MYMCVLMRYIVYAMITRQETACKPQLSYLNSLLHIYIYNIDLYELFLCIILMQKKVACCCLVLLLFF